jgi:uncharacterized protein (DUF952 family)
VQAASGAGAPLKPGDTVESGTLLRRIYPHPNYYDPGQGRVTRQVFDMKKGDEHLSMALKVLTSHDELLRGHDGFGLCEIDVATLLGENLRIRYEPSDQEGIAHVSVRGNLGEGVRRRLARRARVVVEPRITTAPSTPK